MTQLNHKVLQSNEPKTDTVQMNFATLANKYKTDGVS